MANSDISFEGRTRVIPLISAAGVKKISVKSNSKTEGKSEQQKKCVNPFDEVRFANYFASRREFVFRDMFGVEHVIDPILYQHTPVVKVTSFLHLTSSIADAKGNHQKESTSIAEVYAEQLESQSNNRGLIAIIGELGSGKSVYLKILGSFLAKTKNLFVFELAFSRLNLIPAEENLRFCDLLKRSCIGYPFDRTESCSTFSLWLVANQHRCVFICDGFDRRCFPLYETLPSCDLVATRCSTAHWVSLLLSRRIMCGALVVVSSRPAGILKLPIPFRPRKLLKLCGFDSSSLATIAQSCGVDDYRHGQLWSNLLLTRNPFVFTLMVASKVERCDGDECETSTDFLGYVFDQRRRSIHNHHCQTDGSGRTRTAEWLIDQVLFDIFHSYISDQGDNKEITFTEAELMKRTKNQIDLEDLENHSMITVRTTQQSNLIESGDKIIQPLFPIVTAFHVARYVVRSVEYDEFTHLLTNVLFNINYQHIWYMVRRFVVGLLCTSSDPDEVITDKRSFLIETLIKYLGQSLTSFQMLNAFTNLENFKKQAYLLYQEHLMEDVTETKSLVSELRYGLEELTGRTGKEIHIEQRISTTVRPLIHFLKMMDPKVVSLAIFLDTEKPLEVEQLSYLVDAIIDLTHKIDTFSICGVNMAEEHLSEIGRLTPFITRMVNIKYHDLLPRDLVDSYVEKLPWLLKKASMTLVSVDHRSTHRLIRHSIYYVDDKILLPILKSNLSESCKTINLALIAKNKPAYAQVRQYLVNNGTNSRFDFVVTNMAEYNSMMQIFAEFSGKLRIGSICMVLPDEDDDYEFEFEFKHIYNFFTYISKSSEKIPHLLVFNLTRDMVSLQMVEDVIKNVQVYLFLYFTDEWKSVDRSEFRKVNAAHVLNAGVHIRIEFENGLLDYPPIRNRKGEKVKF